MHPTNIEPIDDGRRLLIGWADGSRSLIDARALRNACSCTACTARLGRQERSGQISVAMIRDDATTIRSVDLPSSSRLSVIWQDGHDRSLYRFADLLRDFPPTPEGVE